MDSPVANGAIKPAPRGCPRHLTPQRQHRSRAIQSRSPYLEPPAVPVSHGFYPARRRRTMPGRSPGAAFRFLRPRHRFPPPPGSATGLKQNALVPRHGPAPDLIRGPGRQSDMVEELRAG
jgi:hypothetical protein